jgi:flagellar protein FlaG
MNIQSITTGIPEQRTGFSFGADSIQHDRQEGNDPDQAQKAGEKNQIQSEELLQNIKALTDNGTYSVRFEMYQDTDELVINLVDTKTGETIRQIPPKEILGLHKTLAKLRGNLVETQS